MVNKKVIAGLAIAGATIGVAALLSREAEAVPEEIIPPTLLLGSILEVASPSSAPPDTEFDVVVKVMADVDGTFTLEYDDVAPDLTFERLSSTRKNMKAGGEELFQQTLRMGKDRDRDLTLAVRLLLEGQEVDNRVVNITLDRQVITFLGSIVGIAAPTSISPGERFDVEVTVLVAEDGEYEFDFREPIEGGEKFRHVDRLSKTLRANEEETVSKTIEMPEDHDLNLFVLLRKRVIDPETGSLTERIDIDERNVLIALELPPVPLLGDVVISDVTGQKRARGIPPEVTYTATNRSELKLGGKIRFVVTDAATGEAYTREHDQYLRLLPFEEMKLKSPYLSGAPTDTPTIVAITYTIHTVGEVELAERVVIASQSFEVTFVKTY